MSGPRAGSLVACVAASLFALLLVGFAVLASVGPQSAEVSPFKIPPGRSWSVVGVSAEVACPSTISWLEGNRHVALCGDQNRVDLLVPGVALILGVAFAALALRLSPRRRTGEPVAPGEGTSAISA